MLLQAWFAFYVLRGGTGAGGADERRFVPEAPPGAGIAGSMLKVRRLALLAFGCIAVDNLGMSSPDLSHTQYCP